VTDPTARAEALRAAGAAIDAAEVAYVDALDAACGTSAADAALDACKDACRSANAAYIAELVRPDSEYPTKAP